MEVNTKYRFFHRFWTQEKGFAGMFILLCIMHFLLIPLFGNYSSFMIVLNIFWTLFVTTGIFSLATSKRQALKIAVIPVLFIVCRWINVLKTDSILLYADILLTVSTFVLIIILVLLKVFEKGPITIYRVIGSVVVYMLLANLWAICYLFFFEEVAGSFNITHSAFELDSHIASFMYFSYITITTTGFGEIVPVHPLARSMVQAEAIVGVLYPVILIGRLVSDANYFNKQ